MVQKTLFISDLHLEESRPDITAQFIQLLNACDASVDALYILGDLFEVWIGDDDETPLHSEVKLALRQLRNKGVPIYFMYGNRDFMIGKKFLRASGCELLPDEKVISLYGTSVLLLHGDTLCTRDIAYLKARKLGRNRCIQFLFLRLPLSMRKQFANKMRAKSMRHTSSTAIDIMDVTPEEVVRVMQKHGTKHLIHGHTHQPAFHDLQIDATPAKRIVLPAWHDRGRVLVWDQHHHVALQELTLT